MLDNLRPATVSVAYLTAGPNLIALVALVGVIATIALSAACSVAAGPVDVDPKSPRPVSAVVDGHEVHSYGEFDVYSVSPTCANTTPAGPCPPKLTSED